MNDRPCPRFDVVDPAGRPMSVMPASDDDTIEDLCRALGWDGGTTPLVDGTAVDTRQRLGSIRSLRHGAELSTTALIHGTDDPDEPVVELAIVGGPACATWVGLAAGRHGLGRSPMSAIRVDDPHVELHHGTLDVTVDGEVRFTQLTGRVPALVDGCPAVAGGLLGADAALSIGSSRIMIRAVPCPGEPRLPTTGSVVATPHDPHRCTVRRGPTEQASFPADPIAVPVAPSPSGRPSATGLIGAGVAVVGAGGIAVLLGQAMFALFALIGAVASLTTWLVGVWTARRARRRAIETAATDVERFRVDLIAARARQRATHLDAHESLLAALDSIDRLRGDTPLASRVWARRVDDVSPLRSTLGTGTCRWIAPVAADDRRELTPVLLADLTASEQLEDVPVPIELPSGSVVAVHGDVDLGASLLRSLVVQLTVTYGPSDWSLAVVSNDVESWSWASWLPHALDDAGRPRVVASDEASGVLRGALDTMVAVDRRPLVVVDDPSLLSARTGALRRFLANHEACCMVLVPEFATVPAVCDRVLRVGSTGTASWRGEWSDGWRGDDPSAIQLSGLTVEAADAAARRLAGLIDPEATDAASIPVSLQLADLGSTSVADPQVIARRWADAGTDPAPSAAIGMSADGMIDVDLVRDGPHGLIAGTTGSGKSELLRTLVVGLAARSSPAQLAFVLVDYKGGSTFDACARLPHTVGVVTDLDEGLAERALVSLDAELRRREHLLRAIGADDLIAYRATPGVEPLPRLVVVIDEFASLARELPEFLAALVGVAQRGRSLGIHLLLATQRPAGVITDEIRANTNIRLALRLTDTSDAHDVVADAAPASFARSVPGRAALRLGPDELVVFQAAQCTGPVRPADDHLLVVPRPCRWRHTDDDPPAGDAVSTSELEAMVDAIREAAVLVGDAAPPSPWCEPLPPSVDDVAVDGASGAIGVIDVPEEQCRRPLRWDAASGNLLLVGALGSGTTSTLLAIAAGHVSVGNPTDHHLYVIDAHHNGGVLDRLEAAAHCGGVVRATETERLGRLLRRLVDGIDHPVNGRSVVVLIDGLGALRTALGDVDRTPDLALLDRILHEGPAHGVGVCATTDGASTSSLTSPAAQRWVFHLDDPTIARAVGLSGRTVPAGMPGRLRLAESGHEAHIVSPATVGQMLDDLPSAAAAGPPAIRCLPAVVDPEPLADVAPSCGTGDGLRLVIGLRAEDLGVAELHVPAGDHILIAGAARAGRSTALRQVAAAWAAQTGGTVVAVARGVHLDPAVFDAGPTLVVVDDAERFDDPDGRLAMVMAGRYQHVTIAASARGEAVRAAYGHWVRDVARSRCGLILTGLGDLDGELLGATLPRRTPIAPRPGLAWLVDTGGHQLVQVAARMPP